MRIATMHAGKTECIANAREALEDLIVGDWSGDAKWGERHGRVAARRPGNTLSIVPDGGGQESRRVEMIWRNGRARIGAIEFNCPIDLVPKERETRGVAHAEMMTDVRAIARWLLSLLAPEAVIDMNLEEDRVAAVRSAMNEHRDLCSAVSVAHGDIPTPTGPLRFHKMQMPSPWAGTAMYWRIPHEQEVLPDDMRLLIQRSADAMPLVCEIDRNNILPGRRFHIMLRPIVVMLGEPEMIEAMRRIAGASLEIAERAHTPRNGMAAG